MPLVAVALVGALLAGPVSARAATYTFTPVADSNTSAATTNTNYGTSTRLVADGSPVSRAYLRFQLQGMTGTVTQATLRVLARSSSSSPGVDLRAVSINTWGETTITYNNAPAVGGTVFVSGALVSGQWLSLDATALVKGNAPVSMALTTTNATARAFSSREDGTSDPQLVVSTTTAPVVAAAGDIACDPASSSYNGGNGTSSECRQKYTSDLLLNRGLAGVLALGDEQYEDGQLFKFQQAYAPCWGRVKAVTHPALGNHEYLDAAGGAQGYFGRSARRRTPGSAPAGTGARSP
jgi:hypothetical protein